MAPPTPCCPRSLPALMEELVEEILLRIPPDEPANLFRAALMCKPWRHILTDSGFLRRYRAFHRAPPLLGYLYNPAGNPWLAPTSISSPLSRTLPVELKRWSNWVLDCRHGCVLIRSFIPEYLAVWDPITGGHKNLSLPDYDQSSCAGAMLCTVDGCDPLNCQDGPFLVVFAGSGDDRDDELDIWVAIYSSETGLWSASISVHDNCVLKINPPLRIRDTVYFSVQDNIILKCDFIAHELSAIQSPGGFSHDQDILMEVDGRLGFVSMEGNCLHMLSWHGTGGWAQHLVMELKTLLPTGNPFCQHDVVGFLEGTNTVFVDVSGVGLFTLDLKSKKVKRVGERGSYYVVLPYTGFYTPDLAKRTHHHLHEDAKIDPLP